MDTEQVYVMQHVYGDKVLPYPEVVMVRALVAQTRPDYALQTHILCCTVSRLGGQEWRNVGVGEQVSDMGTLGFAFVDALGTRAGVDATVRFLPLTVDNFGVFEEVMVGWEELAARFPTTDELRAYFRDLLEPTSASAS